MSIAIQTFEKPAYSPVKEEIYLDALKASEDLSRLSVAKVVTLPGVENTEPIERRGLEYSFENFLLIQESLAEIREQIQSQTMELRELLEKAVTLKEAVEDVGMFTQGEKAMMEAGRELADLQIDISMLEQSLAAKKATQAKFAEWQLEVKHELEHVNDDRLRAYLDASATRVPRLGSLDRTDGTIADRTPR